MTDDTSTRGYTVYLATVITARWATIDAAQTIINVAGREPDDTVTGLVCTMRWNFDTADARDEFIAQLEPKIAALVPDAVIQPLQFNTEDHN